MSVTKSDELSEEFNSPRPQVLEFDLPVAQAAKRDELPEEFATLREAGEFWDTHDSGNYEDSMTEIDLEIELSEDRIYLSVARNIAQQLRRYAREQGVSTETLANLWLQEKLLKESTHSA